MQTQIKGIMFTREEIRTELRKVISANLQLRKDIKFSPMDYVDANKAANDAFSSAGCMAGNGVGDTSDGYCGRFFAKANISTGWLQLYVNIEQEASLPK